MKFISMAHVGDSVVDAPAFQETWLVIDHKVCSKAIENCNRIYILHAIYSVAAAAAAVL
jgi:hypothetical protein